LPLVGGGNLYAGWVTVRPDSDADEAERVFLEELERLGTELVSDDELTRARALIEASELGAVARVEEVADRLAQFEALFDRADMINEQLANYLAVTAEQIRDVARAVFRADNRVVITYVPDESEDTDEEAA
jgi:predicted Zn-dependent peptidase